MKNTSPFRQLQTLLRAASRFLFYPVWRRGGEAHVYHREPARVSLLQSMVENRPVPLRATSPLPDGVGRRASRRRSSRIATTRFHVPTCDH